MKVLPRPRRWLYGAALLLLVLTACGTPLAGESWPGLSSDGHYIYVAYKNRVLRVNPVSPNGDSRSTERRFDWIGQISDDKIHMYAPPAVSDDGVVYVGAYDHKIYAFQLAGGALATFQPTAGNDKVIGGALVAGDTVYVGSGDKGIRALNRKTGADQWPPFMGTRYGVWSTPILIGDTLYFGSLDHFIYALDAKTGTQKWKVDVNGAVAGTPLYQNGILYTGTFANEVVAVSLEQQKVINRYATRGWVWGTPVTLNGNLYFGDLAGWLYAINADSFKLVWEKTDEEQHPGAIRGKLAITKLKDTNRDIVIAGTESKYLYAYDAENGTKVWKTGVTADEQVLSDLVVIGDDVIFSTLNEDHIVTAFNTQTGQKAWWVGLKSETDRLQTATNPPVPLNNITPVPSLVPNNGTGTAAPTAASTSASTAASTAAPTTAATAAQ